MGVVSNVAFTSVAPISKIKKTSQLGAVESKHLNTYIFIIYELTLARQ